MDGARVKRELRETYDDKAGTFSRSREQAWPRVREFCLEREGGRALDLACGNGRNIDCLDGFEDIVGVDFSRGMLRRALRREADFVQADVEFLPFDDAAFDVCVYVAGLHHLPSRDARRHSLNEVGRVLVAGGEALVSVWAIEHPCFDGERDGIRRRDGDHHVSLGDRERFYHVFERSEFETALEESSLDVVDVESVEGNYYA
ncbi:MAG: class I SAM-dependent methyltransferase, partial [Halobacteriota archaeon]